MGPLVLCFLFLVASATADLTCPSGYQKQSNGNCYKIYTSGFTRAQASQQCVDDGAKLLELQNAFDLSLVKSFTSQLNNFWIGATCTDNSPQTCLYDSGHAVTFNDFTNGQADQHNGGPCVMMFPDHPNTWSSYRCDYHASFVCQFDGSKALICPNGYSIFAGNCYKPLDSATEGPQEQQCQADGGHLASVHSIGENTYLTDIVPSKYILDTSVSTIRIGLYKGNGFRWLDGTAMNFDNFGTTKPSGNCAEMPFSQPVDKQKWKPADCGRKNVPAVCKIGGVAPTTTSTTTTTTTTTSTSTTTSTTTTTTTPKPTTSTSTSTTTTTPAPTPAPTTTELPQKIEFTSGCNEGVISAESPVEIWTPHHPMDYRNNEHCVYLLEVPQGKRVELTFSAFDTEAMFDVVNFYDGANADSSLLGTVSGSRLPPKVFSTGNHLTVVFTSDPMNRYSGFKASFQAV